jgi:hypothetical protein
MFRDKKLTLVKIVADPFYILYRIFIILLILIAFAVSVFLDMLNNIKEAF